MIAPPIRPRYRQESGIAAASRLAHRGTPYGASLSFATTTHLWPLSDPPSRKPANATGHRQAARSIPGRALASSMLDSPCQGSRTGLTPPISTSVPSTLASPSGLDSAKLTRSRTPLECGRNPTRRATKVVVARSRSYDHFNNSALRRPVAPKGLAVWSCRVRRSVAARAASFSRPARRPGRASSSRLDRAVRTSEAAVSLGGLQALGPTDLRGLRMSET